VQGLDDNMWYMLEEQMGRRELRPRGRENSTPMLDSDDAFETHSVADMEEEGESTIRHFAKVTRELMSCCMHRRIL
jgi:hypothetical protein